MKDHYKGIQGIYFWAILYTIKSMIEDYPVLDFGCGLGKLSRICPSVINYDKDPTLSVVKDWRAYHFRTVVANQVFYEMDEVDVIAFLNELRLLKAEITLVVGIARRGWLNKLGARLLQKDAHDKYKINPNKELEILKRYFRVEAKKSVFGLCDVYKFKI